jgi:hypothetical protein
VCGDNHRIQKRNNNEADYGCWDIAPFKVNGCFKQIKGANLMDLYNLTTRTSTSKKTK